MVFGAFNGEPAQARIGKDRFHDIGAADDVIDRHSHDADNRGPDVAQAVTAQDLQTAQAFHFSQIDVILPDFVEELIANHVGIVPDVTGNHDRYGQNHVLYTVYKVATLAGVIGAAAGQPAQVDVENEDKEQAHPKGWQVIQNRTGLANEPVEPRIFV